MMEIWPDTPLHVGFAYKDEDDPRRHKSRCIYYDKNTKYCTTARSSYCGAKCGGSAQCMAYAEKRTEEVIKSENEFKKSFRVARGQTTQNQNKSVTLGDSVAIKNVFTGKVQTYIMTEILGKPTGLTSLCLGHEVGYEFWYDNATQQIVSLKKGKITSDSGNGVTNVKSLPAGAEKSIRIEDIRLPVVGYQKLPSKVKEHDKTTYVVIVNTGTKIKNIPVTFDEEDRIFYVSEGAYSKYFKDV